LAVPAKSQTSVQNLYRDIVPKQGRTLTNNGHKKIGTAIACQQHFYHVVCGGLHIGDVTLNSMPLGATNKILYLYTLTLSVGETIQGTIVKSKTINEYLGPAAKSVQLIGQHKDCHMQDPHMGTQCKKIKQHLRDFKRWESMPTRQDPLTKKMIRNLQNYTKDYHQDSKVLAFVGWCIVGFHMGYCQCEWASKKSPKNLDNVPCICPTNDNIYQCILDNLKILGHQGKRISDPVNYPPDKIGGSLHQVRWQKNGQNDQKVWQAANHTADPNFCCT
jgi:hypothetical protein